MFDALMADAIRRFVAIARHLIRKKIPKAAFGIQQFHLLNAAF